MQELAFWSNIALVILAIQCFVLLIVALVAFYALVRVMNVVHGKTETYAPKLQQLTHTVNERTQAYSQKAIQPVVKAQAGGRRVSRTVRSLLGLGNGGGPG